MNQRVRLDVANHEIGDFASDVIERSRTVPVVVDFWAEWCGPCKILGPILERLAEKSDGRWVLAKVDTDKHQELASQYGVRGIPNVKLFVDGSVTNEFTGALPERAVAQWLERALPHKFRRELQEAERLIQGGDLPAGQKILNALLSEQPGDVRARVLLAGTLLRSDAAKAVELVRGIEPDSEFFPQVEAIRTIGTLSEKLGRPDSLPEDPVKELYLSAMRDLAAGHHAGAVEKFISVIRANRYYDDDGSRKACIAVFRMLGEEHEVTRAYRREFGSALNR